MDQLPDSKLDSNHWGLVRGYGKFSLIRREGNEYIVPCRSFGFFNRRRYDKRHKSFDQAFKTALSYRAIILGTGAPFLGWFEAVKRNWTPERWDTIV